MNNKYEITISLDNEEQFKYSVTINGLFMYKDNTCTFDSVKTFVTDYVKKQHDFNECYGAYRFSMKQIDREEVVLFSDNSGMMRYYINTDGNQFYLSLKDAQPFEERKPNYSAIAQFLSYGCVYNDETIVESVVLSNPDYYYILNHDQIQKKSKDLKPLSDYKEKISLNSLVVKALSHCDGKIGCTITGGIDSRSVLSNLLSVDAKPELAITGNETQLDVIIAKKISNVVGLDLTVISDDIEEKEWLDYSIEAADGQDGICEIYRLDKLARCLNDNGITVQFGGVAGELYKNSFINQDFPIYFGHPKWNKFYRYKVGTYDFDRALFTEKMQNNLDKLPILIIDWLKIHKGGNKADAYLNAGYEIMKARCNHVINMFQRYTTVYNPLMERRMAAYAFGVNPYRLEMQAFQRHEVSQHCKKIQNIKTDRGLTCNYRRRALEYIKSNLFLLRVALQRLLFRNKEDMRIDNCFITGHKNAKFSDALNNTKALGIISKDTDIEKIPIGLADRLFTIGMFFDIAD